MRWALIYSRPRKSLSPWAKCQHRTACLCDLTKSSRSCYGSSWIRKCLLPSKRRCTDVFTCWKRRRSEPSL